MNRPGPVDLPAPSTAERASEHFVQFYEDDDCVVDAVSEFIGNGLVAGGSGIVVAGPNHRGPLGGRLSGRGLDLDLLHRQDRYVTLDAAETMSGFMVDGFPDPSRFRDVIGRVFERAASGAKGGRVRIFGEMVALLWSDGRREAAVRLEQLWNELGRRHDFSLFCAYPLSAFESEADAKPLLDVCAEHGHAIPGESYAGLPTEADRMRHVIQLQQKALALGAEVARRKELEDSLRRREQELAEFLESTQDGVMDIDPDGRIRWANRALLEALGYSSPAFVGRLIGDFLASRDVFRRVWGGLVRGEPLKDATAMLRCADGSTKALRVQSNSMRVQQKSLHMRWLLRDSPEGARATR